MRNMSLLNVIEALSEVSPVDHFRNEMMIGEVNGTYIRFLQKGGLLPVTPFRLDDLLLILVEEGSAQINVDYAPCAIEAHSCVTLMPSHVIQVEWVSESFKGQVLVVSRSFLDRYQAEGMRRGSVANYMTVRKHPITPLEPEEQALLAEGFMWVMNKIQRKGHYYHRESLQSALASLLIELANIFGHHGAKMADSRLSRKEELFEQFLYLLHTHFKEQHAVTFYADRLSISSQYLSLILRDLTGKSANKWIDEMIVAEAKMLLKTPQYSVQQVAEQLSFSDQSTFGKFFKKHIGVSPLEFRRSS